MKKLAILWLLVGLAVFMPDKDGAADESKSEPVYQGKTLKEWIKALQEGDLSARLQALRALGEMGPKASPAVPILIRTLEDKNLSVGSMAQITLVRIGKPAMPALLEVFKDQSRDGLVRTRAVHIIGSIGADATEAIPDLIKALGEDSIASSASTALGDMGKAALPSILEALKSEDKETQAGAARALGQMGPEAEEAIPILRRALKGFDIGFRVRAAKALIQLHPKDREALAALIGLLTGTTEEVRTDAMYALRDVGSDAREAITALEAILKEEDERVTAANVILHIQPTHKAALAVILEDLKNDRPQHWTFTALEHLGPLAHEGVPSLVLLLKNEQEFVVDQTVQALGKIGPAAKEAVPALIEALKNRKNIWIVNALGEIGSPEAVPTLIELSKDPDPKIRQYSATALGLIGRASDATVPALLEALKDKDDDVRAHAIMALGEIKPEAKITLPHFQEALKDKNLFVRGIALARLGELGPEAKSAVPELLESVKKDKDFSRSVAIALGQIGPEAKAGIPFLLELLTDEKNDARQHDTRVQAALAIWRIEQNKEVSLPVLRQGLKSPQENVRIEAALALWRMGEEKEKMMDLLMECLKDTKSRTRKQALQARFVRFRAAEALGEIGPDAKAAVPLLIELLGAKDDFLKAVPKALKKIDPRRGCQGSGPMNPVLRSYGSGILAGKARPCSAYNSITAANASSTLACASCKLSPSVSSSGNAGQVTV